MTKVYLNGMLICGLVMVAFGVASLTSEDPRVLRLILGFGFGVPSLVLWAFFRIVVPRHAQQD